MRASFQWSFRPSRGLCGCTSTNPNLWARRESLPAIDLELDQLSRTLLARSSFRTGILRPRRSKFSRPATLESHSTDIFPAANRTDRLSSIHSQAVQNAISRMCLARSPDSYPKTMKMKRGYPTNEASPLSPLTYRAYTFEARDD